MSDEENREQSATGEVRFEETTRKVQKKIAEINHTRVATEEDPTETLTATLLARPDTNPYSGVDGQFK